MASKVPSLQEICWLAMEAGKVLRSRFGKSHQVKYKSLIDPVTEADKLAEDFLLDYIHQNFPDHQIISEESGNNHQESAYCWYIDPLDGTVNYAHGIPIYCVSIGFAINQQIQFAAVFDPSRRELFSAEKGKGSFCNKRKISVSDASQLISSLLVTGFPYDIAITPRDNMRNYNILAKKTQGVRRLGSAALDCSYVAAGRFDAYWELAVMPWDVAAGVLIAQEAGANVSDVQGEPLNLEQISSLLCSSPDIYFPLLKELNSDWN